MSNRKKYREQRSSHLESARLTDLKAEAVRLTDGNADKSHKLLPTFHYFDKKNASTVSVSLKYG